MKEEIKIVCESWNEKCIKVGANCTYSQKGYRIFPSLNEHLKGCYKFYDCPANRAIKILVREYSFADIMKEILEKGE